MSLDLVVVQRTKPRYVPQGACNNLLFHSLTHLLTALSLSLSLFHSLLYTSYYYIFNILMILTF